MRWYCWLNARLQYIQYVSNGDTAVSAINIFYRIQLYNLLSEFWIFLCRRLEASATCAFESTSTCTIEFGLFLPALMSSAYSYLVEICDGGKLLKVLGAALFEGKVNIYLYFQSLLNVDLTQGVEILFHGVTKRVYETWFISCVCAGDLSVQGARAPSQYKDRLIYIWRFPC